MSSLPDIFRLTYLSQFDIGCFLVDISNVFCTSMNVSGRHISVDKNSFSKKVSSYSVIYLYIFWQQSREKFSLALYIYTITSAIFFLIGLEVSIFCLIYFLTLQQALLQKVKKKHKKIQHAKLFSQTLKLEFSIAFCKVKRFQKQLVIFWTSSPFLLKSQLKPAKILDTWSIHDF